MSGRVGNLTTQQQETLDAFRATLKERQAFDATRMDDNLLLRFLRARKFDLQRSLDMILACEQWRRDKQVDRIFTEFQFQELKEVNRIYPRFYHKTDKLGRPLYVEQLGNLDLEQLFKLTTRERLETHFIYEYERLLRVRLPACSRAAGHTIETSCTILDLNNCSVMQALKIKDLLKLIVDIGQNYYPETMGMTFIINAPWLFDTIWSFVKIWMDEVTVSKIKIFKAGKDHMAPLFSLVDPANVPYSLGGACQCSGGCENSDAGPWKD